MIFADRLRENVHIVLLCDFVDFPAQYYIDNYADFDEGGYEEIRNELLPHIRWTINLEKIIEFHYHIQSTFSIYDFFNCFAELYGEKSM